MLIERPLPLRAMRSLAFAFVLLLLAGCTSPGGATEPDASDDASAGNVAAWTPEVQEAGGFRLSQPTPCVRTPDGGREGCMTFLASFTIPAGEAGLRLNLTVDPGTYRDLLVDGPGDCDIGELSSEGGPQAWMHDCPGLGPGEHKFKVDMLAGAANGSLDATTMRQT